MPQLVLLSITDFKLIFRDTSLRVFLIMPLLVFAVILLFLPYLNNTYVEVAPFIPIVLMGATVQTSTMFGFIYAMVLIDEKDMEVAKVYGVLPVSQTGYIISRLIIPFLISTLMTLLLMLVQPFYKFEIIPMVFLSMLCGLMAPVMALLVSILSKNKMEGMTWFKLVNLLTTIPLAAFFVDGFDFLFGLLPTHWAFQALDGMIRGEGSGLFILAGFVYVFVLLGFFVKRFIVVHFK